MFSLRRGRFKYESKCFRGGYIDSIENTSTLKCIPYNYWKFIKNNRSGIKVSKKLSYNGLTSSSQRMNTNLFTYFPRILHLLFLY